MGKLSEPSAENPGDVLQRIQDGDHALREQFIADSLPFIKRIVRRATHSFFVEHEDEFSIALTAYNQAIDHYHVGSDVPFEPFARLLIKNRLLDWFRKQSRTNREIALSDDISEDGIPLEDRLADPQSVDVQQKIECEEAMIQLQVKLQQFGLSLPTLVARFPRHQDSRLLCIRIARQLSEDASLYGQLIQTHRLPGAELSRRCAVPLKTIEKNRASIIFLTQLMCSELQTIKSYLAHFEEEHAK